MAIETETQDKPKKIKSNKKNKQRKDIVSFEDEVINKDRATEVLTKIKSEESIVENEDIFQDKTIKGKKKKNKTKVQIEDHSIHDDSEQLNVVSEGSDKISKKKKKNKRKVQVEGDSVQDDSEQLNTASKASKKKTKAVNNEISDVNQDTDKISMKKNKDNSNEVKEEDTTNTLENSTENTESKRAKRRKKHLELQVAKKLKATLVTQENCLNYLSKWKHSRSEWKFEKLKQIWLSNNLFDSAKIPEEFWATTLEYFTQSRGFVRKVILRDALKLIENDKADEDNPDEEYQSKLKRARDIVQSLQE
ncbi:uncharacterized protein C7orf50 [Diabrotica virgifera virgifera]|uniref:WKF domain-containing protein n=1 Tax=Diabrotica virgifera virgifera TaxID=50390 RepID=A0ABM5I943_DIAVI|nr:uncharacterized protein C7orf50 [Diabrotica virgifera virgifera]